MSILENETKEFLRNRDSIEPSERQIAAQALVAILESAFEANNKAALDKAKFLFFDLGAFMKDREIYTEDDVKNNRSLANLERYELDTKKRALILLAQSHHSTSRKFFIDSFIHIYEEAEIKKDSKEIHNTLVLNHMFLTYHDFILLLEAQNKYAEETAKDMAPAMLKSKSKQLQKLSQEITFHLSKFK